MNGYRLEFKIVNETEINLYVLLKNGHIDHVGIIRCPKDGQIQDNLILANEIKHAFNKRMRKSLWGQI